MTTLWHFSEDPGLDRFVPRGGKVWAIDDEHAWLYWFPRDCVGDLLERHADAGVERRIASALYPLRDKVVETSLDYSGIRLRNAAHA